MTCRGLYVVRMEPASCRVDNRDEELGTLVYPEPGEQRRYHLEMRALPCTEAIAEFEQQVLAPGGQ